jgi:PAS domain S-box-containing protein
MRKTITPSGREIVFGDDELIVSKTYANDVLQRVSGYSQAELIGAPHNLIRHPDMPRCVFKLLWDTIKSGKEIFAYVLNMSRDGGHYWVFAHVTPSYGENGKLMGYHSNRRVPYPDALEKVKPLYRQLLEEEKRHGESRTGMLKAEAMIADLLLRSGVSYDEFVFSLSKYTKLDAIAA